MASNEVVEDGDSPPPTLVNQADAYFSSYEDLTVHELMLKDKPRTLAYKTFMEKNASLFKDKIVIDVGAGSGILSLFAAKAGAKHVYAIEASGVSMLCQAIVAQNDLQDKITVVKGRVEDVSLPIEKADILISEWMGFYLLHEAMFNSVIVARDRWLDFDGLMVPSTAAIYLCPLQMTKYYQENLAFWTDAYGCDLSPIAELVKQKSQTQPTITTLKEEFFLSEPELVTHLDLMYVGAEDISNVVGNFKFEMKKHGVCHGFGCWFDCVFEGDENVTLSTAPGSPETHWQQTVIFLPDAYFVNKGDVLSCKLDITQAQENSRRYNISLEMIEDEDEVEDDEADEEVDEDMNMDDEAVRDMLVSAMEKSS